MIILAKWFACVLGFHTCYALCLNNSYRKTQFCIITVDTSSITMGTGQLVNTSPSNNTKSERDIGFKIFLNSSRFVTLILQWIFTESPLITKLPLVPKFILINCNKSTLKLLPLSDR